jgi:Na+-driven multidrug efflux pump
MAAFDRPITLKRYGIAIALCPSGNSKARRKRAMQLEKATRVLKRVWKVLVWIDLVVVAALLLFFSQFFSYDVFVSNFHRQAIAANSVQPR